MAYFARSGEGHRMDVFEWDLLKNNDFSPEEVEDEYKDYLAEGGAGLVTPFLDYLERLIDDGVSGDYTERIDDGDLSFLERWRAHIR